MIQLLLEVGVRYACAEGELTNRVAGLYLLYSVYFTQPCSPRVLIRLTLEYWTAMQQLHAELRSNKVRIHTHMQYCYVAQTQTCATLYT